MWKTKDSNSPPSGLKLELEKIKQNDRLLLHGMRKGSQLIISSKHTAEITAVCYRIKGATDYIGFTWKMAIKTAWTDVCGQNRQLTVGKRNAEKSRHNEMKTKWVKQQQTWHVAVHCFQETTSTAQIVNCDKTRTKIHNSCQPTSFAHTRSL